MYSHKSSINQRRKSLFCWKDHDPFALGSFDVSFEVCLSPLSHFLEVALVEVCKHFDASRQALHVFLEVEAMLGEL